MDTKRYKAFLGDDMVRFVRHRGVCVVQKASEVISLHPVLDSEVRRERLALPRRIAYSLDMMMAHS